MNSRKRLLAAAVALVAVAAGVYFTTKLSGHPDENPKRRYDPNWKVTGYFNDADTPRATRDFDRLEKELGDGYTITRYNTDKDMACKMGMCHKPLTYIVERPGWEDSDRTADSRQGSYLEYDSQLKPWVDETVRKGAQ